MTTQQANNKQIRCIRALAKKYRISAEKAAALWCDRCAKHWREMQG